MRLSASSIPLLFVALAGCQGFGPPPDVSAQPHATIAGTHMPADGRIDTFRTVAIDGHAVQAYTDEPAKLIGVDEKNLVAAGRPVRVEIEGMAFSEIATADEYARLLRACGMEVVRLVDLTEEWTRILVERLAMYRSLEPQTVARLGREHFERYDRAYEHFVGLYRSGVLAGALVHAVKAS